MITAHDVSEVTFPKAMRGYNADEVDKFLDLVQEQVSADAAEIEMLKKANEEQKDSMYLLVQKIEEYRADEDNLKSALINAQRMGENIIREANQKAEGILRDATVRGENIVQDAQQENAEQIIEMQRVKAEVAQFKGDVLSLYKLHIESLSTLPEEESAQEEIISTIFDSEEEMQEPDDEAQAAAQAVVQAITPEPSVEEPVQEAAPEPEKADTLSFGQHTATSETSRSFWEQDEETLKEAVLAPEVAPTFEGFKGIKFSD